MTMVSEFRAHAGNIEAQKYAIPRAACEGIASALDIDKTDRDALTRNLGGFMGDLHLVHKKDEDSSTFVLPDLNIEFTLDKLGFRYRGGFEKAVEIELIKHALCVGMKGQAMSSRYTGTMAGRWSI